jgi:hypothetical protein
VDGNDQCGQLLHFSRAEPLRLGDEENQAMGQGVEMSEYNHMELTEVLRSIESTRKKCEKATEKLREGSSQRTLTARQISAFLLAEELITEKFVE